MKGCVRPVPFRKHLRRIEIKNFCKKSYLRSDLRKLQAESTRAHARVWTLML